ncbi:hypothetical protein ABI59_19090 [Acidobacteria bacterium Mor1]|nr:hypothetical protein ABI59_19090 [Acidobacteria bacterium Mor1]
MSTKLPREPRQVAICLHPGAEMLDVTGPMDVFATANRILVEAGRVPAPQDPAAGPAYRLQTVAVTAAPLRLLGGLQVLPDRTFDEFAEGIDTVVVPGGPHTREHMGPQIDWLHRVESSVRRIASVCTGAFVLAEAGLLDDRRATTHWESCDRLARRYPRIRLERDALYVKHEHVYTSAGITAGIDLCLALVEEDLGRDLALAVARELVVFLKRPGGQSQFSTHLLSQMVEPGPIADLMEWIVENLDQDLRVELLAERVAMSPRHFARVFTREVGETPARFVELARLDAARRLLTDSAEPLEQVAARSGFQNAEQLRRSFRRHLSVTPREYRRLH